MTQNRFLPNIIPIAIPSQYCAHCGYSASGIPNYDVYHQMSQNDPNCNWYNEDPNEDASVKYEENLINQNQKDDAGEKFTRNRANKKRHVPYKSIHPRSGDDADLISPFKISTGLKQDENEKGNSVRNNKFSKELSHTLTPGIVKNLIHKSTSKFGQSELKENNPQINMSNVTESEEIKQIK